MLIIKNKIRKLVKRKIKYKYKFFSEVKDLKKGINKVIAIGIGFSIMYGSAVPAFAADNTTIYNGTFNNKQALASEKKVLTLKTAVDAAIENSDKLYLKSKEIKYYKDKMDLQEKLDDLSSQSLDFSYDKLDLQRDQAKQDKEFMADQIESDITQKYNDIVSSEIELGKLSRELDIKNKDLKNTELKEQLGLITATDLKSAQLDIQTLNNKIKVKQDTLKNKRDYLGVLTNLDLSNYELDKNINYEVFKIDGSVDEYIDEQVDKYLEYTDQMVELLNDTVEDMEDADYDDDDPEKPSSPDKNLSKYWNEDSLGNKTFNEALYKEDVTKGITEYSNKLSTYGSYLEMKFNADSTKVTVDDSRKSLKDALKTSYANLKDLENQITVMKGQIELTNKKLEHAKLQSDLGLITVNEYNNIALQSEELDSGLRSLVNGYNTLKDGIEKPWVLVGGTK